MAPVRRMSRRRWSATWLRPCPRTGSRVRLRGIVDVLSSPTTQPTNGRPPPDPGRRLDRSGRLRWATVATAGTTMHHTALRARVEGGCTLSRRGRAKGARPAVLSGRRAAAVLRVVPFRASRFTPPRSAFDRRDGMGSVEGAATAAGVPQVDQFVWCVVRAVVISLVALSFRRGDGGVIGV